MCTIKLLPPVVKYDGVFWVLIIFRKAIFISNSMGKKKNKNKNKNKNINKKKILVGMYRKIL